jgi:nitrate reductase gamma subunit
LEKNHSLKLSKYKLWKTLHELCFRYAKINGNKKALVETAEQKSAKLARNVHWMVLYQICVFGADLKSNMAARVHNVTKSHVAYGQVS